MPRAMLTATYVYSVQWGKAGGGHLASGEPVIAVAGTGRGSDTALVMQAASSQHLKWLRVNELICKPLNPLTIEELRERMAR